MARAVAEALCRYAYGRGEWRVGTVALSVRECAAAESCGEEERGRRMVGRRKLRFTAWAR